MKNVFVVGAGQLGSRHLQALKRVGVPLNITVIDPSITSLKTARERYGSVSDLGAKHQVEYLREISGTYENIDLAIISTNSSTRRQVVEKLLKSKRVKYFIMEKLLFHRYNDYAAIKQLLMSKNSRAWVNCSMRSIPFYSIIKNNVKDDCITYIVCGSQYGLITNAIHYIDHLVYLSNCDDYVVDTTGLDNNPIPSKRHGFIELNGTLNVFFKNGSFGSFTCFPDGELPVVVEIASKNFRFLSKESEQMAIISEKQNYWHWYETEARIPYQSERTTSIVEQILLKRKCVLPTYNEAAKIHLSLLEPLKNFLNRRTNQKYDYYPFT